MDGYLDDFADNLSSQTIERLATFGGYFANEALDEIDRLSQSLVVLYDNDTPAALLWVMVSPMAPSVLGFIFTKEDITQFSDEIKAVHVDLVMGAWLVISLPPGFRHTACRLAARHGLH